MTRDPLTTALASVCTHALVTVGPDDSIDTAVRLMREHAEGWPTTLISGRISTASNTPNPEV